MPHIGWVVVGVSTLVVVLALVLFVRWAKRRTQSLGRVNLDSARNSFHLRREWLEADFLSLASHSGRPRGLEWVDCDFEDEVAFARDRHTGQLRALVGVTIAFEAIAGGDMEDNPNVGNLRAATAVFKFEADAWTTDGRAIFNLNPTEAIQHFQNELEFVE